MRLSYWNKGEKGMNLMFIVKEIGKMDIEGNYNLSISVILF